MSERAPEGAKGLLESLATLASTLVTIAHTRLNLISVELEEGLEQAVSQLVAALLALFFLGIAVVLATMLIVFAFWDSHRLLSLGILACCFLVLGIGVRVSAVRKANKRSKLFSASLAELSKDRQQLTTRS